MSRVEIFVLIAYIIESIVIYWTFKVFMYFRFRLHRILEPTLVVSTLFIVQLLKVGIHFILPGGYFVFDVARIILSGGLDTLVMWIFFKGKNIRRIILILAIYASMFICDCITYFIFFLIEQSGYGPISNISELSDYIVVLSRTFLPIFLLFFTKNKFVVNKSYLLKHSIVIIAFLFISIMVVAFFPLSPDDNPFFSNQQFLFMGIFIFVVISAALLIALSYTIQTKKRMRVELKALNNMQRIQYLYNSILYTENTNYQNALHDLRNLMDYLLLINQDDHVLESLAEKIGTITKWTGNQDIDTFLCYQHKKMDALSIRFSVNGLLPKEIYWLHTIDILVIICNALDNAVEAAEKVKGNRYIDMKFIFRSNELVIDVENPFIKSPDYVDGTIQTTKSQPGHGNGLKNIKMVVEDYHGDLSISTEKGIFKLSVWLQQPKEIDGKSQ